MSLHDNDDDLFEYEPESSTVNVSDSFTDSSSTESQFINSIKTNYDDISESGSIKGIETRLGSAFLSAANFHISTASQNGHAYAARYILDEVSDGKFSLLELFKTTEIKIIKLLEFIEICESILEDEDNFITQILELIGVSLTPIHVQSIYKTHLKLSQHSLLLSKALYLELSEKLLMPVNMELFEAKPNIDDIEYRYSSLVSKITSNIISQNSAGISQKLTEGSDFEVFYNNPQADSQEDS